MTHILIVGKKFSGLSNKILEKGYTYTVLQDRLATKTPDAKLKNRVVTDFSNIDFILSSVDELNRTKKIDAVITVYESYILPTTQIGQHLGVAHLPIDAAEACTDKFLMRSLFAKAPEKISPGFDIVSSKEDLINFANSHSFPLILKPANLAKSLLVTKSDTLEELLDNYAKSMQNIQSVYQEYAPNRTPKLIVEEYLDGHIHSVDAFIDSEGNPFILNEIVDYQTGYDIGYHDNFHYSRILPSKLSQADQDALRHCAEIGARALGMKNSPAHIEIIVTKDGPRIVEIGARNGGYRERMHRLANDIDILGSALDLALGITPRIVAKSNNPVAVLELFPKNPGNFVGVHNESELRQLPSLEYLSIKPTTGKFVGKAGDGYKMCAVVILANKDTEQFNKDLEFVNSSVFIETA